MADFVSAVGTGGTPLAVPDLNFPAGLVVAIGAASAQSAPINARVIYLSCDQNCWITVGTNPTASAGAGSMVITASSAPRLLSIQPGQRVAVIQTTTAGNLSIIPAIYPA